MDHGIKQLIEAFCAKARELLGENLKAVFLYGSIAAGCYSRRHSDINILLVLGQSDLEALRRIGRLKHNYKFRDFAILALTRSYIESSTDTFPMEFLDIRESYSLLWGEDCIKGLRIDPRNLRHQCEWELKSKILRMQGLYIDSRANTAALRHFLTQSLSSFSVVFKNILRLKGIEEREKKRIWELIASEFGLNKDVVVNLWQARAAGQKIADAEAAFGDFLGELQRLSEAVDKLSA